MSAFRAVNNGGDMAVQTLSQPLPAAAPAPTVDSADAMDESSVKTPTRDSFLHLDPVPADAPATPTPARPDGPLELPDIKPEPKDGAETAESAPSRDAKDGSEQDSGEGDGRPSKKKKGQRFFCTEYPPCILSFTRSEHLARHIRYNTRCPARLD
jgi:C2H2 transcription facotor